jgi:DNA-binding transcriptional ArsR family regulator
MVECIMNLDEVFGSLADPTRRDILNRVAKRQLSISEIAASYDLTFAAVSKHLKVLERAKLVMKHRRGKQQFVQLAPSALKDANDYLKYYQSFMEANLDSLEQYLKEEK